MKSALPAKFNTVLLGIFIHDRLEIRYQVRELTTLESGSPHFSTICRDVTLGRLPIAV